MICLVRKSNDFQVFAMKFEDISDDETQHETQQKIAICMQTLG
jgi:hypothetical protein